MASGDRGTPHDKQGAALARPAKPAGLRGQSADAQASTAENYVPVVSAANSQGVQIGDQNVQNLYFGRPPVRLPHMVGVVPPLADCRQERPADRALAAIIDDLKGGASGGSHVLTGLGGVGKTQLAANLSHTVWNQRAVDALIWVTASSRTGIITRYAQAGADLTGVHDADPLLGAERFLSWLGAGEKRWLLVLDDLVDPVDVAGLWPPTSVVGTIIVTTRRQDSALLAGSNRVDVGVFTTEQADSYLRQKLGARPQTVDQGAELAEDLGYLPLALAQAAAYILDHGHRMTCAVYRRRFADERNRLTDLAPLALPDHHQATVAASLTLSARRAIAHRPVGLTGPVLELASVLDSNAIPLDLFVTRAVIKYCIDRLGHAVTADSINDAQYLLNRFSLVSVEEVSDSLSVHALVQRAIRDAIVPSRRASVAHAAADALVELWPGIERNSAHAQVLRANAAALQKNVEDDLWGDDGAHDVLTLPGHSLLSAGHVAAAADHFQSLRAHAELRLGAHHPHALTAGYLYGNCLGASGDYAGAAAVLKELHSACLRVLGPGHQLTFACRPSLATWIGEAGDPTGAVAALIELVTDSLRALGPDHPTTLSARHDLANWRGRAGDATTAAAALEHLLAEQIDKLGPDHTDIGITQYNLAYWRGEAGDVAGAKAAFEEHLAELLRFHDSDHPDVLIVRYNLADCRGNAGDPQGAVDDLEELLVDRLRVLGPGHPATLTTRRNLARWRGIAGNTVGAVADLAQLLIDQTLILGADHAHTRATQEELGKWRLSA